MPNRDVPSNGSPPQRRSRRPARARWFAAGRILLALCCPPCLAAAQESARANAPKIEAAFLRNFAHYVTWPASAFPDERSPWRICVLGADPFGEILEDTFNGRTEQGRAFEIVRTDHPSQVATCQIVFIGSQSSASQRALLAELKYRPVLTVGDAPDFLQDGGMIRFQVSDHVDFGVNLDRTHSASLKVQTKMLEVAQEVFENGAVRRRR